MFVFPLWSPWFLTAYIFFNLGYQLKLNSELVSNSELVLNSELVSKLRTRVTQNSVQSNSCYFFVFEFNSMLFISVSCKGPLLTQKDLCYISNSNLNSVFQEQCVQQTQTQCYRNICVCPLKLSQTQFLL